MVEYPIKIDVEYMEGASRLEALIVRWLYAILLYVVLSLWSIAAGIVIVVQWLSGSIFWFWAKETRACMISWQDSLDFQHG